MIETDRRSEESRLDAMMELERIAELKKLEEREKRRVEGKTRICLLSRHFIHLSQPFLFNTFLFILRAAQGCFKD